MSLSCGRQVRLSLLAGMVVSTCFGLNSGVARSAQQIPEGFGGAGHRVILAAHAAGAQIYGCEADDGGRLAWRQREPIATLIVSGKTVGRHFVGPTWELDDGSAVVGKVIHRAQGATPRDVPLLMLDVVKHRGSGQLNEVTLVERLNTSGGQVEGSCDTAGALRAEPYAADYLFLQ